MYRISPRAEHHRSCFFVEVLHRRTSSGRVVFADEIASPRSTACSHYLWPGVFESPTPSTTANLATPATLFDPFSDEPLDLLCASSCAPCLTHLSPLFASSFGHGSVIVGHSLLLRSSRHCCRFSPPPAVFSVPVCFPRPCRPGALFYFPRASLFHRGHRRRKLSAAKVVGHLVDLHLW